METSTPTVLDRVKPIGRFLMDLFGKVVLEFIWLLCSVSLGMYVVGKAAQVDLDPIVETYSRWLVMVLFNAAMFRYIVAYGLERIDRELDRGLDERRQMFASVRQYMIMAARSLFPKKPNEPDENQ